MRWLAGIVCAVAFCGSAAASNYVCGDTTKLGYYAQGIDPSKVPACTAPWTVSEVPEADISAQDALYATVPPRHLKVVAGLMVEMTPAEKAVVDTPTAAQAARAAFLVEMNTQDICSGVSVADIQAKIATMRSNLQTDIDGITNIATAKTELAGMMNKLTTALEKIAICTVGLRKATNR